MSSTRGTITLFKNIFEEPATKPANAPTLREKKVMCLIDFYYYTGIKTKKSYSALLDEVSQAFFLSTITIHDIIQQNLYMLTELKQSWKERPIEHIQKDMQKKWPHLQW